MFGAKAETESEVKLEMCQNFKYW